MGVFHFFLIYLSVPLILAILKLVCLLVAIAYYTLAERKVMAAFQRRMGPNVVGPLGLLQPLADGLKLAGKEFVIPSHSNSRIFLVAAIATLALALIAWIAIPFNLYDYSLGLSESSIISALV
jgi:NADH-quinone oxidoreductase subunit H